MHDQIFSLHQKKNKFEHFHCEWKIYKCYRKNSHMGFFKLNNHHTKFYEYVKGIYGYALGKGDIIYNY